MGIAAHARHDVQRLTQGFAPFVRAVRGGQCLEDIGNCHHSGRQAHVLALQAFWITAAIHFFMMTTRQFDDVAQIARERQAVEHQDGLHDVIVDDVAFLGSQCAAGDTQIV